MKTNEQFSDVVGGLGRGNTSREEGFGSLAHLLSNK